jgi:lipopolysaccharide export system protein LptA
MRMIKGLRPALVFGAVLLMAAPALCAGQDADKGSGDQAFSGMKLSGDKPIQVESDKLEVHEKDNTALFTGNVNVVQGTTLLKAGRMTVHYVKGAGGGSIANGSANIDSIEVDGKVYVKTDDQIATGDHGTYDMKTQILVLEGDQVVLTQGDNVVIGCKLTANLQTGLSKLDGCGGGGKTSTGRVKVLLTPQKKATQ